MNTLNVDSLRRHHKSSYDELFGRIYKMSTRQIKCDFIAPLDTGSHNRFKWLSHHLKPIHTYQELLSW